MDTESLCSRFDIATSLTLSGNHRIDDFKGLLMDNYIMQALATAGIQPYYWTLQQNAELDFIFRTGTEISFHWKQSRRSMCGQRSWGCS